MSQDQENDKRNGDEEFGSTLYQRTEELYKIPERKVDSDGFIESPAIVLKDIVVFPHMISRFLSIPALIF